MRKLNQIRGKGKLHVQLAQKIQRCRRRHIFRNLKLVCRASILASQFWSGKKTARKDSLRSQHRSKRPVGKDKISYSLSPVRSRDVPPRFNVRKRSILGHRRKEKKGVKQNDRKILRLGQIERPTSLLRPGGGRTHGWRRAWGKIWGARESW